MKLVLENKCGGKRLTVILYKVVITFLGPWYIYLFTMISGTPELAPGGIYSVQVKTMRTTVYLIAFL